jgi:hypothetical protein
MPAVIMAKCKYCGCELSLRDLQGHLLRAHKLELQRDYPPAQIRLKELRRFVGPVVTEGATAQKVPARTAKKSASGALNASLIRCNMCAVMVQKDHLERHLKKHKIVSTTKSNPKKGNTKYPCKSFICANIVSFSGEHCEWCKNHLFAVSLQEREELEKRAYLRTLPEYLRKEAEKRHDDRQVGARPIPQRYLSNGQKKGSHSDGRHRRR